MYLRHESKVQDITSTIRRQLLFSIPGPKRRSKLLHQSQQLRHLNELCSE